jgi:RNA polymerase sigma factor
MKKPLSDVLSQAQQGDLASRECIIQHYRPFIIRVASGVCKRHINWNDDEASVSLIAFNEAIDGYSPNHCKTFENFSQLIIRNRLIDEFRRNSKRLLTETLSYSEDDGFEFSKAEIASSLSAFEQEASTNNLAKELLLYDEILLDYGISLEELEDCSPSHKDTRIQLIHIAKSFIHQPSMVDHLYRTKQLPLKEMLKYVKVSRKTLERNRKYLISLILIYSSEDFSLIRNTISFTDVGE